MKKFDAEASKKLAESFAHRGLLPPEMGFRWDAQGAFIAGQRLMFEQLHNGNDLHEQILAAQIL